MGLEILFKECEIEREVLNVPYFEFDVGIAARMRWRRERRMRRKKEVKEENEEEEGGERGGGRRRRRRKRKRKSGIKESVTQSLLRLLGQLNWRD